MTLHGRIQAGWETALCDWCAYWDLCPVKKHLAKLGALPADKWKDEPGVIIADAYAGLWRKKKALEAETKAVEVELDVLRDAAIAFAEKEDVQVIAGTDARLKVTARDKLVAPAKGTEERAAFEGELRAPGVWDEVSTLDAAGLERALEAGKWGPEALARVRAYVAAEKRYTVTLREESKE